MKHSLREERGSVVVAFTGEVDLEHSPQAREVLLEQVGRRRRVLVDLSGVDYIDSSGIASLVEGLQAAKAKQLRFGLFGVSATAMSVLKLARLEQVFTFHPALPSANG